MAHILILHGPNLNLLGKREVAHYGTRTLAHINERLVALGQELGHTIICRQHNAEHALIEEIHAAMQGTDFILINPAAFTHTSIALRDALLAVGVPYIEIHLSNVYAREPFRQISYFSDCAMGVISGFGGIGYELALRAAHAHLLG